MLGGFLIAAAVVLVLAADLAGRPGPEQSWVAARVSLPAGTRLTAADLTTVPGRLGTTTSTDGAFRSPTGLVGQVLAVPVAAGQLLVAAELQAQAEGAAAAQRPVAVSVTSSDLVDLSPGDLVDVMVTPNGGSAAATSIVVRGARLVAVNQASANGLDANGTASAVVTLDVETLPEVQAIIAAEHDGSVDLVLGRPSDGSGLGHQNMP